MFSSRPAATLLAALTLALPLSASAQARASEKAGVSQTISGAEITLEYYRPVARGRSPLFGKVVKWGEVWTPGANWATTLEVSRDFKLNGHAIPKGKYSMWMIPVEQGDWTVFLHKESKLFHVSKPKDKSKDVARFTVMPESGPHVEVLTFSFPTVSATGASLRMQWGETVVPMDIVVTPADVKPLTAEERAQYVGEYTITFDKPEMSGPKKLFIRDENGTLRIRMEPSPGQEEGGLIPVEPHKFWFASYEQGKLFDVEIETYVIFKVENGRAQSYEVRSDQEVFMRGTRVK